MIHVWAGCRGARPEEARGPGREMTVSDRLGRGVMTFSGRTPPAQGSLTGRNQGDKYPDLTPPSFCSPPGAPGAAAGGRVLWMSATAWRAGGERREGPEARVEGNRRAYMLALALWASVSRLWWLSRGPPTTCTESCPGCVSGPGQGKLQTVTF